MVKSMAPPAHANNPRAPATSPPRLLRKKKQKHI
jgi:hypothetical protein